MCGIMGYTGSSNTKEIILNGLSRLEYRGYDSAGISFLDGAELKLIKKEGKLKNLVNSLKGITVNSTIGIGHTRWATHGGVNDINAHPHMNELFSIVHNGIIENANELRSNLKKDGHHFSSETDSEVFLELLTFHFKKSKNIKSAIWETFGKIEGNSAFVIMQNESTKIYSIKKSAPIVCGLMKDKNEAFISSDPYALMGLCDQLFFPEDNVLVIADYQEKDKLLFEENDGSVSKRVKTQLKELDEEIIEKGSFDHFMLKEIHEQPLLVRNLLKNMEKSLLLDISFLKDKKIIHLVSCGTALYAGMVIKHFLEENTSLKVLCDFASEFRYKTHKFTNDEVALFISQSGETADTLACQEICLDKKLSTFSIVNVEGSTLFRNSDLNFLTYAGTEIGVASTKAFTQQVLVGSILTDLISDKFDFEKSKKELDSLASVLESVLSREEEIKAIAQNIYNYKGFIFTGRGIQFPIAMEGALKLKEIAYVHAEGYAAGELKHGPIALIDESMVNIAIITPELYQKTYSNAQEVKARKGMMVVIGEENSSELESIADYYFGLNFDINKKYYPVQVNLVLQLLSYHIAKLKGTDIDKPRNLAKSVTVE